MGFLFSPVPSFSIGGAVYDITGTFLSWDTGRHETITPSVRVGTQVTRSLSADHMVTLAGDVFMTFDGRRSASQFGSGTIRH